MTVLMTAVLWCSLRSGRLIAPAPFFFLKLLWLFGVFCVSTEIFCSSSVENAIDNLIGVALNL